MNTSSLQAWETLYDFIDQIKERAPWDFLYEDQIFGIQDPITREIGYVSIMGHLGEHIAIAVYKGTVGLAGFSTIQEIAENEDFDPLMLIQIPHLQASWEDRSVLDSKDRNLIKNLGRKYRGKHSWPMARSYKPGFYPWFLDDEELRYMNVMLQQVLAMLPELEEDSGILEHDDPLKILVRVPEKDGDEWSWSSAYLEPELSELYHLNLEVDSNLFDKIKKLPHQNSTLEICMAPFPFPTQESPEDRPVLNTLLLTVDHKNGMILDVDFIQQGEQLMSIFGKIPNALLKLFDKIQFIPKKLFMDDPAMEDILGDFLKELRVKIVIKDELPKINEAMDAMFKEMTGGFGK